MRQAAPPQATSPQATVEAEQFIVRDKHGNARGELAVLDDETGTAGLRLFGKDGNPRVFLGGSEDFSVLLLRGAGNRRIMLESSGDASPLISLSDGDGKDRLRFQVADGDGTSLTMFNLWNKGKREGQSGIGFFLADDGPSLSLFKFQEGKTEKGVELNLNAEAGSPYLEMSDAKGRTRVNLGLNEDDVALSLFDKDGKARATLGSVGLVTPKTGATEQTAESSLVLFDKGGKVIFQAPR